METLDQYTNELGSLYLRRLEFQQFLIPKLWNYIKHFIRHIIKK